MGSPGELLRQAGQLAAREPRRPLQASLRRAVSASYYALFHLLVDEATRRMFPGSERAHPRRCVARAFGHLNMRQVAQQFSSSGISPKLSPGLNGQALQPEIVRVATAFVELQQLRHEADYDMMGRFTRKEVLDSVERAEQAVSNWNRVRTTIQADTFLAGLLAFGNMRN